MTALRSCSPDCILISRVSAFLSAALVLILLPLEAIAQGPARPLAPEAALAGLKADPEVFVELAAAEPDVIDPVYIAFDPRGRMWVVQMGDYPNGPAPGEPGRSSIRVLTDANGDGRYTDPVVFADGLLFANSLMFWQDGVLVTTDGRLDFLADRNGDGRAEFRETWFEGFSRENPQLRANSPTLGHDGMIYVANGLRGGKVKAVRKAWGEHEPIDISGRDFCFDPFTGEAHATSGHGQFGMSFDDFGRRFVCSNRNPCTQVIIPEWALRKNPNVAVTAVVADAAVSGEASRIYPISRFWTTSNLHAGQFTAACGLHIFRGDGLGPAYYGNAFTCDPTGNLIHRELLEGNDVVFKGRSPYEGREFLASEDTWFRPVNLATGPDGALYVADMYRAVIEHPQFMPDELKNRPDLTLGTDRGRIYRVVNRSAARPHEPVPPLHETVTSGLVAYLDHPSVWQRETAFRLLLERQDSAAADLLTPVLQSPIARPQGKVLAFWLLANLGRLSLDTARSAVFSESGDVIEQVTSLAGFHRADVLSVDDRQQLQRMLSGLAAPDVKGPGAPLTGRLRFQIALAMDEDPERLAALLLRDPSNPWLATAIAISAGSKSLETAEALLSLPAARESQSTSRLIDAIGRLLEPACKSDDLAVRARTLIVVEKLAARNPQQTATIRSALWSRLASATRVRVKNLPQAFGEACASAGVPLEAILDEAIACASSSDRGSEDRINAIRVLELAPFERTMDTLRTTLNSNDAAVAAASATILARLSDDGVGALLLENYSARSPSLRREIQTAIFRSEPRIAVFLDEIDAGRIAPTELDQTRMQQLARVKNTELKERAAKLIAANRPADRTEVIEKYQPALQRKGDPAHGRELFTKNCSQCHRIGDVGVNVAPDISDSRVKQPSQLLTDILDPNRAIDNNYFNYLVIDRGGTIHSGVIATETSTSITLRQPEDKRITIARENVEQIRSTGQSLMPVGLEKALSVEDMSDLISFIKNWRYLGGEVPQEVIR